MQAPSLRQLIAFRGGLKLDSTAAAYRSYYGFGLFFNLILWVPVFYEIQRRCGLSDREIFTIQSVYHLVFCLFEIPTGFFADRFGYHRSLTLGAVSFIAANLIVVLRSDAVGFALHFFAVSLSRSLVSGAASAWLYDFMRERGESQRYKQVEGRARALGLAGKVICWSAVGWLVNLHLMLPYWLTAGCGVAAFAFARSLPAIGGEAAQRRPLWLVCGRSAWFGGGHHHPIGAVHDFLGHALFGHWSSQNFTRIFDHCFGIVGGRRHHCRGDDGAQDGGGL